MAAIPKMYGPNILESIRVGPRQGLNPKFEDCRAELYQFSHMALLIQIIVIALNRRQINMDYC